MKKKNYYKNTSKYNEIFLQNEFKDDIVFARFINYMQKSLLNRKLNYLRHKKYLLEKEIFVSKEEWEKLSNKDNYVHSSFTFEENDKKEELKIAIDKLTEKQRQVITLYYYKNKKIKVIAEKMNMNENAVKQLKLRAISKLKTYLEDEDGK